MSLQKKTKEGNAIDTATTRFEREREQEIALNENAQ
jgi:hypothetical protein